MLSPIDKLLAIEAIKTLKARYFRYVDSHDWASLRGLFAEDAVLKRPQMPDGLAKTMGAEGPDIKGAADIVAWIGQAMDKATSAHMGYMPEIEILSENEAQALWGMRDVVRWNELKFSGYGYYRETYVRRDGAWFIKTWSLSYKDVDVRRAGRTAKPVV